MHRLAFLRFGALDLISAAVFLGIWLLRDRFEYDTLRSLLLWPVVFEMFLAVALFLIGMSAQVRSRVVTAIWYILVGAGYFFAAWLTGATADMPQIWTIALWLLVARALPPRNVVPGSRGYAEWLLLSAGTSGMLWGAGFVLMMLLVMVVPGHSVADADGTLRSTSPSWIFPLVWTPYFIAEGVIRARRQSLERSRKTGGRT